MSPRASKVKAGRQILGCRGRRGGTGDDAEGDEIGERIWEVRRRSRKAETAAEARTEVARLLAAGGRPVAERLDVVALRLEPDRDHDCSPARSPHRPVRCRRPLCADALVPNAAKNSFGPGGFPDVVHGKEEFDWPQAPSRRARSDTYRRYCRYWRQVRTATTWVFFQTPSESLLANPVAAGLPNSVFAVLLNI